MSHLSHGQEGGDCCRECATEIPIELQFQLQPAQISPVPTDCRTLDLRIYLLGGFRVKLGGRLVHGFARRLRPAKLLKLLALTSEHSMHREEIQDLLWPDFELDAASNNLHRTIYALRRSLEPNLGPGHRSAFVRLSNDIVELDAPGGLWVDVEAFERGCAAASRGQDTRAQELALELYAGDLLPEDRYEDWAAGRREALRERFVGLLLRLAELHEASGDLGRAAHALERVVACEPAHEEAHTGLMRLYAQAGQRHRALRQYHQLVRALDRELDAAPDPASRSLQAAIRAGQFPCAPADTSGSLMPPSPTAVVSEREEEVAGLVAGGLTNRAIAERLGLSVRTVDVHVSRVLRKLGAASRRDIALWIFGKALGALLVCSDWMSQDWLAPDGIV